MEEESRKHHSTMRMEYDVRNSYSLVELLSIPTVGTNTMHVCTRVARVCCVPFVTEIIIYFPSCYPSDSDAIADAA